MSSHTHMSYTRVGRRCHGTKGFRLNSRRFSVQGLRARFFSLFRLLSRWRSSYGRALRLIKKLGNRNDRGSSRSLMGTPKERQVPIRNGSRLRSSLGRSNSFYSEAIADCLEFIKRSSLSVDQKQSLATAQI